MINISRPKSLGDLEEVIDSIAETERTGTTYTAQQETPKNNGKAVVQKEPLNVESLTSDITNLVLEKINGNINLQNTQTKNPSSHQNFRQSHSTDNMRFSPQHRHFNLNSNSKQDQPIRNSRTTNGRPICFYCNKPGHTALNCYKRQNIQSRNGSYDSNFRNRRGSPQFHNNKGNDAGQNYRRS